VKPRRNHLAICLSAGVSLFVLGSASADAGPAAAGSHWRLICSPGEDEYASNCEAIWEQQGLKIDLATGDSQLFLTVEAPHCATDKTEDANWFRVDLEGLPQGKRRRMVLRAINDADAKLRKRCAGLPDTAKLLHDPPPDIVMHGSP
jgi:hypothetical protein